MSRTIAPGIASIRICARCQTKHPYLELIRDQNTPGVEYWVCPECCDERDPYTLPPRQPDPIAILYARPDTQLTNLPVQQNALATDQVVLPGPNVPLWGP